MTRYAFENHRRYQVRKSNEAKAVVPQPPTVGEFSIECPSGRYLDFINPDPATITLEDIAHSLSQICRWGGHCSRPYSVAEHAVRVSEKLEAMDHSPRICMAGLNHDNHEYALGDVPTPLKKLFGYSYRSLVKEIDKAIQNAIGWCSSGGGVVELWTVDDLHSEPVRKADAWALWCEAHELMPSKGEGWAHRDWDHVAEWGATDPQAFTYGWDADNAEWAWVNRFNVLKDAILEEA